MVAKMSGTVPGTPQYNSLKYNHVLEYYQQYQKTMQQQQRQQQLQQQYQQQRQQHQKQEQFRHQQQQFEEQQRLQHQQQQFDEQQRLQQHQQQHQQQQQQQLRQQYEEYQQNYDVDYEEPERRWMVSGGMGDELVAKYDYTAQDDLELSLTKNEKLILLDDAKQWWKVQNSLGNSGFVPSNFVKRVRPSLLSSLRNTLGRRKGNHVQHSLRNGSGGRDGGGGGADGENNGLATVESQFCDKCPAVAKYAYTAQQRDELSLSKGDRVMVLEKSSDGWWKGCKDDGHSGWFPSNYVQEEADNNTYADPADRGSGDSGASPPTLETVAALYPYTSDNTEELNFAKDDELEIIEKPLEDPEWWRARNRLGETGLIPRNYVQTVAVGGGAATSSQSSSSLSAHSQGASSSRTPSGGGGGAGGRARYNLTGPFAHKDWFFGSITRGHAEGLLNTSAKLGDFLIRESETNAGDFSISLKAPEKNKHFRVVCENGMFCIGPQTFDSLDDLVQHYKKHPIFRHGSEKLYLIKPFVPPDISEGEEDELVV